jgi:hypothetical protein
MKIKVLAIIGLAAIVGLGACRGSSNTANTTNANTMTNVSSPTPLPKTNESAATDPNLKGKIEAALKAKGFTDVTVDTSTTPATLRGSYPKDRIAEVMATAMEANGGKPVQNQATGK